MFLCDSFSLMHVLCQSQIELKQCSSDASFLEKLVHIQKMILGPRFIQKRKVGDTAFLKVHQLKTFEACMKMHYLSLATAKKYGAGENENHELLKRVFFSASCTTAIITTIHFFYYIINRFIFINATSIFSNSQSAISNDH